MSSFAAASMSLPATMRGRWPGGGGERLVLRLEDMVFTIADGRSIEIAAPAGARDNDIRVWLLGTVMAALLHQRGYFCFTPT
jgi:hypothetical protein